MHKMLVSAALTHIHTTIWNMFHCFESTVHSFADWIETKLWANKRARKMKFKCRKKKTKYSTCGTSFGWVGFDLPSSANMYIWIYVWKVFFYFVWDERCVLTAWWFTQFGRNLIRTKKSAKPNEEKKTLRATCELRIKSSSS